MWTIWGKLSYFHCKFKTIWKIPKVENVIPCFQFPFILQNHLVSSSVVKLDALQKRVQLKEMHYPMMKWIPWLREKV
jgi:hypothetical protein